MVRRATLLSLLVACSGKPDVRPPQPVAPDAGVAEPRVPEPPVPTVRIEGPLRVKESEVVLRIDPANDGFHGDVSIYATLDEPASLVWLNADRLTITSAKAMIGEVQQVLEIVPQDHDFVGLRAKGNLPAGELVLALEFDGVYETHDSMGAFVQPVDGTRYVFSQLEALGARRVFPCIDEPSSKVPWRLSLVVPDGDVAISNTPIAEDRDLGDGRHIVVFEKTKPLPSYLVAFAVGPFDFVDAGTMPSGAPIRVAAFRGQGGQAGYAATDAARTMGMLEDYFGRPFPYAKLDLVPIPTTTWFGAMENAGMITFRQDLLFHEKWTDLDRQTFVWYLAHEGAHQWFGDLVTMSWWDDIWLNEGFATWMEEKVMATFQPGWVAPETWVQRRNYALTADGLVTARMVRQPIAEQSDIQNVFDGISYQKAATVIRMFERQIGEDAFRDGVRAYLEEHAYGNATSSDFLASIDAATELDVTAAFSTFLDQAGAPRVSASMSCDQDTVTVTLAQDRWLPRGATAPAGDAPLWSFPVCVSYGDGKTRDVRCTTMDVERKALVISAACPTWILPNADGTGYYRVALDRDAVAAVIDKGWSQLTDVERLLVAQDVTAMVSRGDASLGDQLDVATKLGTKASKEALGVAVSAAWTAHWVAGDASKPKVAKWIRDTFGKQAAKLGWTTGEDDTADTTSRRGTLLSLVAYAGEDAKLLASAEKLANKWPDLPEVDRARVMSAAVRVSKPAREKLIDALRSKDQRLLGDAVAALSNIDDPDAAKPALEALLDPEVDLSIAYNLVTGLAQHEDVQPIVVAFVRDHWDALLPRIPEQLLAATVYAFTASCDAADRPAIEAWTADHLASVIGGPRTIAQALEGLDQCVTQKAALAPELEAWLKQRKKR